ncbi:glycosyltransferase [Flavobacterium sp.]|uniref:glycosyltransferase family 2 protein n=1 Tax=Flavobacterium sp. TaxID=239 RepID=UPI003341D348
MSPFFSVCIPATGRSRTILRALESLINQEFDDFEIIVSTRNDNYVNNIVDNFIKNSDSKKIKIVSICESRIKCNDWNDSIKHAQGRFIAVLEGDDYYYKDYLKNAFITIQKFNYDVCLFATTNRHNTPKDFVLNSNSFFKFIYGLRDVPAPSESIFPRLCNNNLVEYNIQDFIYAPEIDLYLRLTKCVKNFVRIENTGVFREISSDPYNRISFLFYRDHLFILFKFFKIKNVFLFFRSAIRIFFIYNKSLIIYILWRIKK